jgi:ketosteroid isomerase-like protein
MSQENVETIQRVYDAFNRHDLDHAAQQLHPDCELYPALVGPGQRSQYLGRDAAREFFELISDVWETMAVEAKRIIELPEGRILAVENWHIRGRDGIEIDTELTDLYAFRDGLIIRVDGFRDRAKAFEATGLRE